MNLSFKRLGPSKDLEKQSKKDSLVTARHDIPKWIGNLIFCREEFFCWKHVTNVIIICNMQGYMDD